MEAVVLVVVRVVLVLDIVLVIVVIISYYPSLLTALCLSVTRGRGGGYSL